MNFTPTHSRSRSSTTGYNLDERQNHSNSLSNTQQESAEEKQNGLDYYSDLLSLETIRNELVKIEDTVIFALIERASFAHNSIIYKPGAFNFEANFKGSFLDFVIHELEVVHAKLRRYTSPDEYPFTSPLPEPILPPLDYPPLLHPNTINLNDRLKEMYIQKIVPLLCVDGDDLNYGSSATKDTEALQILSRRIHFEAKFRDPKYHDEYVRLIKNKDSAGILALLTNEAVEQRLLRRVRKKALIYGQEIQDDDDTHMAMKSSAGQGSVGMLARHASEDDSHLRIPLDLVVDMYKEYVIPLTKEVEVLYLLSRLD